MTPIDIAWAGTATTGAERLIGAPDAHTVVIGDHVASATVRDFQPHRYEGLAEMLAGAVPPGDAVTPEMLASADVIAFDHNGAEPAASGGFESCDWTFQDGIHSVSLRWDGGVDDAGHPLPRDRHVVANGTVTGAAFARLFEVSLEDLLTENPAGETPEGVRVSFLLFRLQPEVTVHSPRFSVTISGSGKPDVDAVGVLRHPATIRIRSNPLAYPYFIIPGITPGPLDGSTPQLLVAPAGTYGYCAWVGSAAFEFTVSAAGLLDYDRELDRFLSGRGSSELVVRGLAATLNAQGMLHELSPVGSLGPAAALQPGKTHRLRLVPGGRYRFRSGPPPGTMLQFQLTEDGTLGLS